MALLEPGTWVVHSTASAIMSFVSMTWQPGLKPAEGEPLKAAQTQPWVCWVPGTTCFALHSLEKTTIHQVWFFSCKHLSGRSRNTSAAVWPSSSSNFSPSLYFSLPLLQRGAAWPERCKQSCAAAPVCRVNQHLSPPENAARGAGAVT